ncbi:hypothetical protein GCM10027421_30100 [Microbacterium shaanxiense]
MSAVAITRVIPVPRGASLIERASIRLAAAITRWATGRAQRREDRRATMLTAIQAEQTRRTDPLATEHLLAQVGLMGR